VDVSGQTAPAPDTVGVPEGQTATIQDPNVPGTPPADAGVQPGVPTSSTDAGSTDTTTSGTDTTSTPPADIVSSPPADTTELPAWASNETADPGAIRAIELGISDRPDEVAPDTTLPDGNEAVQSAGDVYVSPTDPELGEPIARWLERAAARDSRLSPVVERLVLLDNIYFRFASDDPVLARPAETTAA
jgi:hypothetical protein